MSIRLRFTLALAAVGFVLLTAYSLWSYRSERADLRASSTTEISVLGRSLAVSIGNALRDGQGADIEETLGMLAAFDPLLAVHVHGPSGNELAHTRGAHLDAGVERMIADATAHETETVQFEPPDDPTRLVYAAPLLDDAGVTLGTVSVVRPIDDLDADLARTRTRMLVVVAAFLVLTIAAGLVLGTLQVGRPLARLLEGVQHVRDGDFRSEVPGGGRDEIGKLVEEFNRMIAALATSRTRTETEADARARLEQGLQRVDKLVTIGQLSAGLAHEIGSPLQVMAGRAALLVEHADPEVKRQASLLVAQCDRITRVIEQLLALGRRRPAAMGRCDVVPPVRAVIDLMSVEARRRGVKLELVTSGVQPAITGDPDQLQQIALNLVKNALAATAKGGSITVSIAATTQAVQLRVVDTGRGIAPDAQAQLFEPFFTTRGGEGGTGLGLAVVKSIAVEHHATIEVHSEPGSGAEFVVTFPRAEAEHHG